MSKLSVCLSFVVGAAAGAVVAWKLTDKKYSKILDDYDVRIQEEIDSVKQSFEKMKENLKKKSDEGKVLANEAVHKPDISTYAKYANVNATKLRTEEHEATFNGFTNDDIIEDPENDGPKVIPPEEFGDIDDYETISLTYYSDGVLADDNDTVIKDIDDIVGSDFYEHFGEYEDDSVFVRNDDRKTYYEILFNNKDFSDIMSHRYHY